MNIFNYKKILDNGDRLQDYQLAQIDKMRNSIIKHNIVTRSFNALCPVVHNYATIKKIGTEKRGYTYEMTIEKTRAMNNFISSDELFSNKHKTKQKRENVKGDDFEKSQSSIYHAKKTIKELAMCNDWELFCTFTIDPKKYDRTDLQKFYKDFAQMIRNYKRNHNIEIKYLFVPELHSDGESWHLHGFISGLPVEMLKQFQIGNIMGKHIADKVKKGEPVYQWELFSQKFGFNDLEPIKNAKAVSLYITKYVNKQLGKDITEYNAKLYYHSTGLKRAEKIKEGVCNALPKQTPSYKNEYCHKYSISESELSTCFDIITDLYKRQDKNENKVDYFEILNQINDFIVYETGELVPL